LERVLQLLPPGRVPAALPLVPVRRLALVPARLGVGSVVGLVVDRVGVVGVVLRVVLALGLVGAVGSFAAFCSSL
jgi:hypothetical protein